MPNNEKINKKRTERKPSIAPSMEMDELEEKATPEEREKGDFTSVTQLYIDRIGNND